MDVMDQENNDSIKIHLTANGSFVYKADLRAVLGIETSRHYRQEIHLLCKELDGFQAQYQVGSDLLKVRLGVAIIIVSTILSRETGKAVEVLPLYSKS